MSTSYNLLVLGSGSVGKRHARNFSALGCGISCMDPRVDRTAELAADIPIVSAFTSVEEAFAAGKFDGVVICSPPHVHEEQTVACLKAGLPVLLEKPVCPDLAGAHRLAETAKRLGVPVLLGYTWRWWPPLGRVRTLLAERSVGTLRHVRFVMSAHLADWHPWERYQDFFMARREQGGGALLDESHWTDLACWMFGAPKTVSARIEKLSDLDIDTDDNVDMLLTYPNALRVSLHLDLYGRPHEKSITFVGETGTIRWSADPNQVVVGHGMTEWDSTESFECERNDMFVAVANDFLNVLDGKQSTYCTLADGVTVLRVIEAARRSSLIGRTVCLAEVTE
jgi:predicted dehydrogenase